MKKSITYLLVVAVMVATVCGNIITPTTYALENVDINEANFPNEVFRGYINETLDGIDGTAKDGILSQSEITMVTRIEISWNYPNAASITDVTGISHFTNLEYLSIYLAQIEDIDLSSNTNLTYLRLMDTKLSSINVNNNVLLETLIVSNSVGSLFESIEGNNRLMHVNLTNNVNLETVNLAYNEMQTLLLPETSTLTSLSLRYNELEALDLSKLTGLVSLNASKNNLTNLDFVNNKMLQSINISENQIQALELNAIPNIQEIIVSDNIINNINLIDLTNLNTLNISNNALSTLSLTGVPNIMYLNISNNQLETLDITMNTKLSDLQVYGNITNTTTPNIITGNEHPYYLFSDDLLMSKTSEGLSLVNYLGNGIDANITTNITKIESYAFSDNDSEAIGIPSSVNKIENNAIVVTKEGSQQHIYFRGDAPIIDSYALPIKIFDSNGAFTPIIIYTPMGNDTWTEEVIESFFSYDTEKSLQYVTWAQWDASQEGLPERTIVPSGPEQESPTNLENTVMENENEAEVIVDTYSLYGTLRDFENPSEHIFTIDVTKKTDLKNVSTYLSIGDIDSLVEFEVKGLEIKTNGASIILDLQTLKALQKMETEEIKITSSNFDLSSLDTPYFSNYQVGYEFTILDGTKEISYFDGGNVEVSMPFILDEDRDITEIVVDYITLGTDAPAKSFEATYKDGRVYFMTNHFSLYVAGYTPQEATEQPVPTPETDNTNTDNQAPDIVETPTTGDATYLYGYGMIMAMTVLLLIFVKDRKIQ